MFQGNWKCSKCGGPITELPFEPRSEAGLTCRACYMKQKDTDAGNVPPTEVSDGPQDSAPDDAQLAGEAPAGNPDSEVGEAPTTERPKFSGDWKCAGCGNAITSLPFEPRSTENLKCIDCFKKG